MCKCHPEFTDLQFKALLKLQPTLKDISDIDQMKMHFPRLDSSLSTRGIANIINPRLPQYPGNSTSSKMSTKQLSRCNNQETVRERTSQYHSSFSTSHRNDVHGQQTPFSRAQRKQIKGGHTYVFGENDTRAVHDACPKELQTKTTISLGEMKRL